MEKITLAGKKCFIEENGTAEHVFLWAWHDFSGSEFPDFPAKLRGAPFFTDCAIAAFTIEDWNAELSPWEAPQAFGDGLFSGYGPETLRWLTEEALPSLKKRFPAAKAFYPMGYSLAGLFSLWALYETGCFSGCVCCSGSLWIDHWAEYAASRKLPKPAVVYLSLGGKEEKTENPLMKKVGDRTREQLALLNADPNVVRCTLFWNKGGHFSDASERLSKGIRWILGSTAGKKPGAAVIMNGTSGMEGFPPR